MVHAAQVIIRTGVLNIHPEVSSAGGFPFVPSVDVDRFKLCSVGWTISLLIEGNTETAVGRL